MPLNARAEARGGRGAMQRARGRARAGLRSGRWRRDAAWLWRFIPRGGATAKRQSPGRGRAFGRRYAADRSDSVELIGDIVVDVPEIADICRADEGVGGAVMAPVKQVHVVVLLPGRRDVGLRGLGDDDGE